MLRGRITQAVLRGLDQLVSAKECVKAPAHLVTGRHGEEDAYFYLRRRGYSIIARNFRTSRHRGEIDLIGWDKDVLCFVEVKTRSTRDVKPAEAAVDRKKRRDLRVMIRYYLRTLPRRQFPTVPQWRFDIVTVYYGTNNLDNKNIGPPCRTERDKGGANSSLVGTPTFELFQNVALSS